METANLSSARMWVAAVMVSVIQSKLSPALVPSEDSYIQFPLPNIASRAGGPRRQLKMMSPLLSSVSWLQVSAQTGRVTLHNPR